MPVFVGQLDVFDPIGAKNGPSYGGEIGLCAVRADNLTKAIRMTFEAIEAEGASVKAIDFFGSPEDFPHSTEPFGVRIDQLERELTDEHLIVFSSPLPYDRAVPHQD